jgi:alanine-glyoxylate transaminase / serine-glyoxylate transaminase / serine-pyruvate transaminase
MREVTCIEIGGGLGSFAGKAWRTGLMGHGATDAAADAVVTALERLQRG